MLLVSFEALMGERSPNISLLTRLYLSMYSSIRNVYNYLNYFDSMYMY